ncbi:hypothetical protein C8Q70DRAFT_340798 [Cubamyces menziesii]|nr:hypothetical protein C8Q70DRAFT_340798 [Cubamyces menziesii]
MLALRAAPSWPLHLMLFCCSHRHESLCAVLSHRYHSGIMPEMACLLRSAGRPVELSISLMPDRDARDLEAKRPLAAHGKTGLQPTARLNMRRLYMIIIDCHQ